MIYRDPHRRVDSLDTIQAIIELEEALGVNLREDAEQLLGLTQDDREFLFAHVCQSSFEEWQPPDTNDSWPARVRVIVRDDDVVLFVIRVGMIFGLGRLSSSGPIRDVRVYPSLARASYAFRRHD
jgi:hypothetical protein